MSNETESATQNSTGAPPQAKQVGAPQRTTPVGYGKPPLATRFKKGQSGNPQGRPKAAAISDIAPLIESVFAEPIAVREGEQTRTISNLEAMLLAQVRNALQGDPKAIRTVFKLGAKAGLFSKAQLKSFIEIVEPEGEAGMILRSYHADQARQAMASGTPPTTKSAPAAIETPH
jgi:hypothetical protein